MTFEPIGNFMFVAAKQHNLDKQAVAGLTCQKSREILRREFPDFVEFWDVKKFVKGELTIKSLNSTASSVLLMQKEYIIDLFDKEDFPLKIREISIIRN